MTLATLFVVSSKQMNMTWKYHNADHIPTFDAIRRSNRTRADLDTHIQAGY